MRLTETTNDDGVPSTDSVGEERTQWETDETSDSLDSVEETKSSTLGVAEIVLPSVEGPGRRQHERNWAMYRENGTH